MGNVKFEIMEPNLSENIEMISFFPSQKDYQLSSNDTFLIWIRQYLRYDLCKNKNILLGIGIVLFLFFVLWIGFFFYIYFFYIQK